MKRQHGRRAPLISAIAIVTMAGLSACSGGKSAATTAPSVASIASPTTVATTVAPTTAVSYVTKGAKVVVANASRVNGAASRMTKQLAQVGYTLGKPTDSGATLQRIDTTKVFFTDGDAQSQAVAESIKAALGGGAIEVTVMPTPAPTSSGELEAGTTVLVAIGNDVADKSLDQLQGKTTTTATTTAAGSATGTSTTTAGGTAATTAAPTTTAASG